MPNCFIYNWLSKECKKQEAAGRQGEPLIGTGGNKFEGRGLKAGDMLYIVANMGGVMHLIGRMEQRGPVQQLENPQGSQYIQGKKCTPRAFDRRVPAAVAQKLRFEEGRPRLCFRPDEPEKLTPQTLRAVRKLRVRSAGLLDELLPSKLDDGETRRMSDGHYSK